MEAIVEGEHVKKEGEVFFTKPKQGNLHSILAVEDMALFDIILPNYNWEDRRCDYYKELTPEKKKGEVTKIEYCMPPEDFDMKEW